MQKDSRAKSVSHRNYKVFWIILLFNIISHLGFSQWTWLNPLPQGNSLHRVQFVDSITGFAVGDGGTILKTSNAGQSWVRLNSTTNIDFCSVFFVSVNIGFVCAGYTDVGYIYKTIDGGSTWFFLYQIPYGNFTDIWFTDENIGYVCGYWNEFYKTTNGGVTWIPVSTIPHDDYYSIYFTDSLTGYVSGYVNIYKTTNGGSTWTVSYNNSANTLTIYSFFFTSYNIGYAVGNGGTILKTSDGGLTWIKQIPGVTNELSGVFFPEPSTGFIVGQGGLILKTTNGGNSWIQQSSPVTDQLTSIFFPTASTGLIVGWYGATVRTNNYGNSWIALSSHVTVAELRSIVFTNSNTGYCAGQGGRIIKTIDSGTSWTICPSGTNWDLYSLCFTDQNTGYVSGGNGTILKTTNAGSSWVPTNTGTAYDYNSIIFPTNNIGYAFSYFDILSKTTNAGLTWNSFSLTGINAHNFYFTSADTGYICGNSGKLIKTLDGGNSFINLNSGTTEDLYSIYFVNKYIGFLGGNNGVILKTIDGGNIWIVKFADSNIFPHAFSFPDSVHGFALDYHKIIITNDGGETWNETSTNLTGYDLENLTFTNKDTGYLSGINGVILKTNSGGVITSVFNELIDNKLNIFPNPNQGEFFIELPGMADISTLQIFNLSGLRILNSFLPGYYKKIKIQLGGISPGLYFIRLVSKNNIWTGKVLIIQ
jgi:photosystem II stability/assembly factor-like uncharacterized protein